MTPMKVHGPIRIRSLQTGTTKWKEGRFEIVEKDNRANLMVHYNAGGSPKTFQLNQNIRKVILQMSGAKQQRRLLLMLKNSSSISIDKVPHKDAEELKQYLETLQQGKFPTVVKSSLGSSSFGSILGSRAVQQDSNWQHSNIENQTPSRRASFVNKDDTPLRKPLGTPGRASDKTPQGNSAASGRLNATLTPTSTTPLRAGMSENRNEKKKRVLSSSTDPNEDYPKENDSSTNNKVSSDPARKFLASSREKQLSLKQAEESRNSGLMPLQTSTFYSSRSSSKDYSAGSSLFDSFSNLGNTCYMNAILQSLFSLQPFANDLLKQGIPWKKIPTNTLLRRFSHLLAKKDVCSPEVKKDLLKKVKNAISATAERFSGYMQNDAHEFLSQCLDQLKEDMEKLNKTWKSELSSGEESSALRNCEDTIASRVYTCPVVASLEFEVHHSITCKMCGEMVTKREHFNDLSIDLPRRKKLLTSRSIQDSLDLFFRAEEIEYSCEKCSGKSAIVSHKFSKLPRVLILHLKRYSYNVQLSLNSKVRQQVVIPKYLTLLSHCTETTRPPLTLGWSMHTAMSRPLKASQSVNSCTVSSSTPARKYSFKSSSSQVVSLDSDSEEEQLKRAISHSQRLFEQQQRDQQQEEEEMEKAIKNSKTENEKAPEMADSGFDGMSEEELLAAVLEMSKRETPGLLSRVEEEEEKPTNSPDTGFGDEELQELTDLSQSMEMEKPKGAEDAEPGSASEMAKDSDENKENKTPEGTQSDMDWQQQYDLEREREEQELQQALAQSLQEQEAREQKEDDDLKRATELSLQEFNSFLLEGSGSDEDSGNEEVLEMEYTENEAEELKRNAETGELPHSYRLISVVSHIGSSSSSGHYISDVFDIKKQAWFTYNDLEVSRTQESSVQSDRDRSGYIFFYVHKYEIV
nr:PREDICTED: ubiquitin carboxyl-terminal hydrolase 37 [Latimeria chalumnae]|eukprot:XP_005991835.1 PREDICTED: ubiquitin carboxyl-terminal hydrolase 37 [Latimeria chalumnae]